MARATVPVKADSAAANQRRRASGVRAEMRPGLAKKLLACGPVRWVRSFPGDGAPLARSDRLFACAGPERVGTGPPAGQQTPRHVLGASWSAGPSSLPHVRAECFGRRAQTRWSHDPAGPRGPLVPQNSAKVPGLPTAMRSAAADKRPPVTAGPKEPWQRDLRPCPSFGRRRTILMWSAFENPHRAGTSAPVRREVGERSHLRAVSRREATCGATSRCMRCHRRWPPPTDANGLDGLHGRWSRPGGPSGTTLRDTCRNMLRT